MVDIPSMRNHRLWVGIALMALSAYLVIKLYNNLFLNLRVPVVAVGPDGVLKVIGSIQPFTNPVLAYDIIMSMILTSVLSSIASVLIYSSIITRHKYVDGNTGSSAINNDGNVVIRGLALTSLEKRALLLIQRRGGMMTQAELGRELGLSKYQISRLTKRLEAKGVIERKRAGVTNVLILRNGFNATLNKVSKGKD